MLERIRPYIGRRDQFCRLAGIVRRSLKCFQLRQEIREIRFGQPVAQDLVFIHRIGNRRVPIQSGHNRTQHRTQGIIVRGQFVVRKSDNGLGDENRQKHR